MTIGPGNVPQLKSEAARAIAFKMATASMEWNDANYRSALRKHIDNDLSDVYVKDEPIGSYKDFIEFFETGNGKKQTYIVYNEEIGNAQEHAAKQWSAQNRYEGFTEKNRIDFCEAFATYAQSVTASETSVKILFSFVQQLAWQLRGHKIENRHCVLLQSAAQGTGKSQAVSAAEIAMRRMGFIVAESGFKGLCGTGDGGGFAASGSFLNVIKENRDSSSFYNIDQTVLNNIIDQFRYTAVAKYVQAVQVKSITNIIAAGNAMPKWADRRFATVRFSSLPFHEQGEKADAGKMAEAFETMLRLCPPITMYDFNHGIDAANSASVMALGKEYETLCAMFDDGAEWVTKFKLANEAKTSEKNAARLLRFMCEKGYLSNEITKYRKTGQPLSALSGYFVDAEDEKLIDAEYVKTFFDKIDFDPIPETKPSGYGFAPQYCRDIYSEPTETFGGQEYEVINPVDLGAELKQGWKIRRRDELCVTLKNLIFESDTLSREKQFKLAEELKEAGVINRAVWSGGKSLHMRVTLADAPDPGEPDALKKYSFIWDLLNKRFFGGAADTQCKNPSRLCRAPMGERRMPGGNVELQYLHYESAFPLEYMADWRDEYEADAIAKKAAETKWDAYFSSGRFKNGAVNQAAQMFEAGLVRDGERHKLLPSAIGSWQAHGYELGNILPHIEKAAANDSAAERNELVNYAKKLWRHEA